MNWINTTNKKMDYLSYKTVSVNKENANKKWYVVDAEGQILGRLASQVAMILRGKRKACFTPHSDCGDNVIIINAEKVVRVANVQEPLLSTLSASPPSFSNTPSRACSRRTSSAMPSTGTSTSTRDPTTNMRHNSPSNSKSTLISNTTSNHGSYQRFR